MRTVLAIIACSIAFAQEFEVASIKSAGPPLPSGMVLIGIARGGPESNEPTHINWPNATLFQILQAAYDIKGYQIEGPDWLKSERYNIAAVVPEGATKDDVSVMWRNLLASRFNLTLHKIQKEFTVDELVVGPGGHKLKENTEPLPEPAAAPAPSSRLGPNGNLSAPGMMTLMPGGPSGSVVQVIARAQPVSALATMLSNQVGHPVLDKTDLPGRYDFRVEFTLVDLSRGPGEGPAPARAAQTGGSAFAVGPDIGVDLVAAIQQQLGLRLVKGKAMLDVLVIDKAEKVPTEN